MVPQNQKFASGFPFQVHSQEIANLTDEPYFFWYFI